MGTATKLRQSLLLILVALTQFAIAMPAGWNGVWDQNMFVWCKLSVDGVPDASNAAIRADSVISGTNVNISLSAMLNPQTMVGNEIPSPPGLTGTPWTSFRITKVELEIDQYPFDMAIAPIPSVPDTRNLIYAGHVRFASNYFAHNELVLVRMRVAVELKNATETKSVTSPWAEWTCRVYNRALTWATAEEYTSSYVTWPDGPYASEAKKGALYAQGSVFSGPLRHDLLLGSQDIQERYRSPILNALGTSTLTLPFTHGEAIPVRMRSSKPTPGAQKDEAYLTFQDISTATNRTTGSGIPLPNMAILYICNGGSGNAFMNALKVNGLLGSNRVGIGFDLTVYHDLLRGPTGSKLGDQCIALLNLLKAGWTAKAAVIEVEKTYTAKGWNGTAFVANPMKWYGDANACIAGVYTGQEKKGDTTWYLVKSSALLSDTQ